MKRMEMTPKQIENIHLTVDDKKSDHGLMLTAGP